MSGDSTPRVAPLASVVALSACIALAAFGVLAPLTHWVVPPTQLPAPFTEQNQDAETLLFILTFALGVPAALLAGPRIADRVAAGPNASSLGPAAALSVAGLLGALLFVKVSERLPWGDGLGVLLAVSLAWLLAAAALWLRLGSSRPLALPARSERWLWAAAGSFALGLLLSLADLDSLTVIPLLAGLAVAGGSAALAGVALPRMPRAAGIGWDAVAIVLLMLAVPNLILFSPGDPALATETQTIQFHQNFFLGPANQVLGGGAMLIDTLSQYGVGSIYFLDAWFLVAPIGNGTLGFLEGVLAAAVFATAYLILRGAGVGRLLASTAMAVGVVVLALNLLYPIGALLQHGALRFGLPIVLIAAAVLEARRPDRATIARAIQLLTVALASIWALEAFAYSVITLAGLTLFELGGMREGRLRLLGLRIAQFLAACVVAHLLFAAITLLVVGELPEWGRYLKTLRDFLTGGIGDLTYDFAPWSGGLGTAAVLLGSVVAIAATVLRRPDLVAERRPAFVALAGSAAYGIALFSYFVNRSADHILPYVSLPVLMLVTLWISVLLRPSAGAAPSLALRRGVVGGAVAGAAVLVAIAWSDAGDRFSESALGHAVPGGSSLSGALERLWDPPELAKGAREGERLLEEEMPDEHVSTVLTSADLGMEILMETGRINSIPLANPWEDSFVADLHIDAVTEAVDGLEAGDLVLLDRPARQVLAGYRRDPVNGIAGEGTIVPTGVAYLQREALRMIGERFRLETVARGADGMEVAELAEKEPAG